jgi:hypothetical protein
MSDQFTITVGGRTFVCSEGRVTTELNKPDRASGIVATNDLAERGADWAGPARASIEGDNVMHGRVIEAHPEEDGSVALSLCGATMLDESLLPPMVVQQIDRREIVYLAAREAGFAPEDINIHGHAEVVAFQPLWVLAPVCDRARHVAGLADVHLPSSDLRGAVSRAAGTRSLPSIKRNPRDLGDPAELLNPG